MTNTLAFADSLFFWHLANYGVCTDPVGVLQPRLNTPKEHSMRGWLLCVILRSVAAAALAAWVDRFSKTGILLAGAVFAGSLLLPLSRRVIRPAWLAEFELTANAAFCLFAWTICAISAEIPNRIPQQWNINHVSAICISAATFIFIVRGGGLFVRGILEKAGGLPTSDEQTPGSARHGEVIGHVERLVVVLIVMAGSLQALAFFFAAKGLIRSEELKDRTVADYFLLGSLGSFLIALVGGLILQKTFDLLWR